MKILKNLLLILLLILLLYVIYAKYIEQKPLIKILGKSALIVSTGSMEPTIFPEELIIISQKNTYEKGDIVTYLDHDQMLITHRILTIDAENFITKGDANDIADEVNSISQIQGKVIFHSKCLGQFLLYFLKPILILYISILLLIEILKIYRKEFHNET